MLRSALSTSLLLLLLPLQAQYTATVKTSVAKLDVPVWKNWSSAAASMNYPGNWITEGAGPNDLAAAFTAPVDSTDHLRERVEIFSKNAGGTTLADYAKQAEHNAGNGCTNVRIIASNLTDEAHTLEYAAESKGHPVQVKQESRIKNGQLWVLTYTAIPARYDEVLYLADAMFASFTVK